MHANREYVGDPKTQLISHRFRTSCYCFLYVFSTKIRHTISLILWAFIKANGLGTRLVYYLRVILLMLLANSIARFNSCAFLGLVNFHRHWMRLFPRYSPNQHAVVHMDKMNQWTEGVSQWREIYVRPLVFDCTQYARWRLGRYWEVSGRAMSPLLSPNITLCNNISISGVLNLSCKYFSL